ncbi:MAG: phytanoyl-CoA dioxygenase family protein [Rhodopirellula sp.]|nr:phytanoyl-CoA dioxygenase family protein [Rhodopirellula sp.]
MPLPDLNQARRDLDERGFVVLEEFIDADWLSELQQATERLFEIEGSAAGSEFKIEIGSRRLANLVNKGEVFQRVVAEPRLLSYIELVLGAEFKLSSLNARSANPNNGVSQPLHADMGAIADDQGYWVCNSVWMLDDFTAQNGPIRVVPGSHRWKQLPQDLIDDPSIPHPDEEIVTGAAGTVVVMNAHAWHGGTANRTDLPRTALHAFYARRDKPQQQYQRELLSESVQTSLSPELRRILALDDSLNDEVTKNCQQRSGFLK